MVKKGGKVSRILGRRRVEGKGGNEVKVEGEGEYQASLSPLDSKIMNCCHFNKHPCESITIRNFPIPNFQEDKGLFYLLKQVIDIGEKKFTHCGKEFLLNVLKWKERLSDIIKVAHGGTMPEKRTPNDKNN